MTNYGEGNYGDGPYGGDKKPMTEAAKKKWYRRVALLGALLGLVCSLLPPEYRAVCQAVANICTGGL